MTARPSTARDLVVLLGVASVIGCWMNTVVAVSATSTCDADIVARAASRATTACEADSEYQFGKDSLFRDAICAGACVSTVRQELKPVAACVASDATLRRLLGIEHMCSHARHCYANSYRTAALARTLDCSQDMAAALDPTAISADAVQKMQRFCDRGCSAQLSAFWSANPECAIPFGEPQAAHDLAALTALLPHMCSKLGNYSTTAAGVDVCGIQLKSIGKLDCVTHCADSSWCDAGTCRPSPAKLAELCRSPCLGHSALNQVSYTRNAMAIAAELCLQTPSPSGSSPFCAVAHPDFRRSTPSLASLQAVAAGLLPPPSSSDLATTCGASPLAASCVTRLMSVRARYRWDDALRAARQCLGSPGQHSTAGDQQCEQQLRDDARWANAMTDLSQFYCTTVNYSTAPNGVYCLPGLTSLPSYTDCATTNDTCTASCRGSVTAALDKVGACCASRIDAVAGLYFDAPSAAWLPWRTVAISVEHYDFATDAVVTEQRQLTVGNQARIVSLGGGSGTSEQVWDRSWRWPNRFASCFGNRSEFWTPFETKCAGGFLTAPPRRELSIGIAYSIFVSNPEFKASFETSACNDVAEAAKVAVSSVTCSVQSQASSTRQGTGANSKLVVTFQGESQAAADAAAASIDTQTASNSLQLTSTARVVQGCVACGTTTSTSSAIQGAAPPPTPVPELSAGSSPQVSSASSVGVLAAAVLAAAVAVMAL